MVRLKLEIMADLQNVTDLRPSDNFDYHFKVRCTSCNEDHPKFVVLNPAKTYEVSGSKNTKAHLVWRCGNCTRNHTAVFDKSMSVKAYSTSEEFSELLVIECRGLEFTDFNPVQGGLWECKSTESNTLFGEVEFDDEGIWVDYDEKGRTETMITFDQSRWTRA